MENKKYCVYKHTFLDGKVYIGITRRVPETRYGQGGYHYKTNSSMWEAIQKDGWDNIKHEILYNNLSREEASLLEKQLIKEYQSNNPKNGYNIQCGGIFGSIYYDEDKMVELFEKGYGLKEIAAELGCCTRTISDVLHSQGYSKQDLIMRGREKFSENHTKITKYEDFILEKFSKGKKVIEIVKMTGLSRSTVDKFLKRSGITHEEIVNNSLAIPPKEKDNIYNMLLEGKTLKEIADYYKITAPTVSIFINKNFSDGAELIQKNRHKAINKKNSKKVKQYDLDGNYIQTFDSITEAARSCKTIGNSKNSSHISQVCKGERQKAYGYKWSYADDE